MGAYDRGHAPLYRSCVSIPDADEFSSEGGSMEHDACALADIVFHGTSFMVNGRKLICVGDVHTGQLEVA